MEVASFFIAPHGADDHTGTQEFPMRTVGAVLRACMAQEICEVEIIEWLDNRWRKVGS